MFIWKKKSKISPSCCLHLGGGKSAESELHMLDCLHGWSQFFILPHSLMLGSAMWLDFTNGMWASVVCDIAEALNSTLLWGLLSCNEAIMRDTRVPLRVASQPTADQVHAQASPGWPIDSGALINTSSYFKLLHFGVFCSRALLWQLISHIVMYIPAHGLKANGPVSY